MSVRTRFMKGNAVIAAVDQPPVGLEINKFVTINYKVYKVDEISIDVERINNDYEKCRILYDVFVSEWSRR